MIDSPPSGAAELEALVRTLGLGWRLDLFGPDPQRAGRLSSRLADGDETARDRFPDQTVRLTVDAVRQLADRSPDKARAFVEQLFGDGSPDMLVMVWRVLAGADVGTVNLNFEQAGRFRLEVTLRPDRLGTQELYGSDDLGDLRILGQFGLGKLNGRLPTLVGFYPTWRPPT